MMDRDTLQKWIYQSRRDDWHRTFVGSDIRQMLGEIDRQATGIARLHAAMAEVSRMLDRGASKRDIVEHLARARAGVDEQGVTAK